MTGVKAGLFYPLKCTAEEQECCTCAFMHNSACPQYQHPSMRTQAGIWMIIQWTQKRNLMLCCQRGALQVETVKWHDKTRFLLQTATVVGHHTCWAVGDTRVWNLNTEDPVWLSLVGLVKNESISISLTSCRSVRDSRLSDASSSAWSRL